MSRALIAKLGFVIGAAFVAAPAAAQDATSRVLSPTSRSSMGSTTVCSARTFWSRTT